MKLKELVEEATQKSPKFAEKWNWEIYQRKRTPTLEWLMPLLEEALGKGYVERRAKEEVEQSPQSNQ